MADTQEKRIQIIFRTDTAYGAYQDALWFSQTEYDALKDGELEAMKQARVDKWVAVVSVPPKVLTDEEKKIQLQVEIDQKAYMIAELTSEKTSLEAEKAAIVVKDIPIAEEK